MKIRLAAVILSLAALLPAHAWASASPKAVAVLDVQHAWLKALKARDVKTIAQLLAPNYVHVDASGRMYHRDVELAGIEAMPPITENWGQETVDFAGTAAIVHGVSTNVQKGKTFRERYVDVYQFINGRWQAISAQETLVK